LIRVAKEQGLGATGEEGGKKKTKKGRVARASWLKNRGDEVKLSIKCTREWNRLAHDLQAVQKQSNTGGKKILHYVGGQGR